MKPPKLHLRDLFWVVLACGMGLGWLIHGTRLAAENKLLREHLEHRAEANAAAEVIVSAYLAYARLVERDWEDIAYATTLAISAIAEFRDGRRVGSRLSIHDVGSTCCQQRKDFVLESLVQRDERGD